MPQVIILGSLAFLLLKSSDEALGSAANLAKWGAVAGGVWVAGKFLKVI